MALGGRGTPLPGGTYLMPCLQLSFLGTGCQGWEAIRDASGADVRPWTPPGSCRGSGLISG